MKVSIFNFIYTTEQLVKNCLFVYLSTHYNGNTAICHCVVLVCGLKDLSINPVFLFLMVG